MMLKLAKTHTNNNLPAFLKSWKWHHSQVFRVWICYILPTWGIDSTTFRFLQCPGVLAL